MPTLVVSLVLSARGSRRARLVGLGMLDYTLYNFALLFGPVNLDVEAIRRRFRSQTPARWIARYMLFVAAGLTIVYAAQSLSFVATGQVPEIVENTGHLTNIVFALDLTLIVPWFVLAAIWLWQRKA